MWFFGRVFPLFLARSRIIPMIIPNRNCTSADVFACNKRNGINSVKMISCEILWNRWCARVRRHTFCVLNKILMVKIRYIRNLLVTIFRLCVLIWDVNLPCSLCRQPVCMCLSATGLWDGVCGFCRKLELRGCCFTFTWRLSLFKLCIFCRFTEILFRFDFFLLFRFFFVHLFLYYFFFRCCLPANLLAFRFVTNF